jgi:anaerobic magnesium-protoporphyrin IX monomethyl ester cyclase
VAEEVEWLLQRYQPDMLWIADDVFTIHHGWILEYAAELKRRGFAFRSSASRAPIG